MLAGCAKPPPSQHQARRGVYVEAGTWHGIYNVSTSVPVEIVAFFGGVGSYEEVGHEVCPPELEAAYLANVAELLEQADCDVRKGADHAAESERGV